jgi:hypothetical protein
MATSAAAIPVASRETPPPPPAHPASEPQRYVAGRWTSVSCGIPIARKKKHNAALVVFFLFPFAF